MDFLVTHINSSGKLTPTCAKKTNFSTGCLLWNNFCLCSWAHDSVFRLPIHSCKKLLTNDIQGISMKQVRKIFLRTFTSLLGTDILWSGKDRHLCTLIFSFREIGSILKFEKQHPKTKSQQVCNVTVTRWFMLKAWTGPKEFITNCIKYRGCNDHSRSTPLYVCNTCLNLMLHTCVQL